MRVSAAIRAFSPVWLLEPFPVRTQAARQDWKRKSATNCGYCVPCLSRRASLHAAKLDFGKQYGIDVCSDELTINSDRTSADDLRAVTNGLSTLQ